MNSYFTVFHRRFVWPALLLLVVAGTPLFAADTAWKPVFLYSRYFNAPGETRYLPDGTYKEILTRLRSEFEVRVSSEPLTKANLAGVSVLLISNPSDRAVGKNPRPHHVDMHDLQTLTYYVQQGGGLIVLGNQEKHNLEIEDLNKLLGQFGLQFTNAYTDVKQLVLPKETPIIGGLRWAYYTGNQVLTATNHFAKPRPLVLNDLAQKPLQGTRDQAGALMAVAEPAHGRVVVATDAGWISNDALSGKGIGGVSIQEQDNWEIFRRLAHWVASHPDPKAN